MIPDWKKQALETFPELHGEIEKADTPYLAWFEIQWAFENAYTNPINQSLIARVYGYAEWCCSQPARETAADDLFTCVAVCFYEHVPQNPAALADMPRWFTLEDVENLREILSYHVGDEGFQKILRIFKNAGINNK